jgi:heme-degrading monooxygenase HmoA
MSSLWPTVRNLSRYACGVVISLVRFKSALSDEEVQAKFEARADAYERVPGLIEKLYLRYRTGEFGAVYVWEDEDALAAFRTSELGSSIAGAYQVEGGEVGYEVADVTLAVRPTPAER